MKYLLSKGVPLSMANANGTTALHFAAMNGNMGTWSTRFLQIVTDPEPDIVKFLVSSGVPIDGKNNGGNTAMLLAASRGQNNVILYLLSKVSTNCHQAQA